MQRVWQANSSSTQQHSAKRQKAGGTKLSCANFPTGLRTFLRFESNTTPIANMDCPKRKRPFFSPFWHMLLLRLEEKPSGILKSRMKFRGSQTSTQHVNKWTHEMGEKWMNEIPAFKVQRKETRKPKDYAGCVPPWTSELFFFFYRATENKRERSTQDRQRGSEWCTDFLCLSKLPPWKTKWKPLGCDQMKDRDRWRGEGSEKALVESCLFEGKSVYWSYNMTKNRRPLASKKRAGSEAGNPCMDTKLRQAGYKASQEEK